MLPGATEMQQCYGRIVVKLIENHGNGKATVIFKCGLCDNLGFDVTFKEEFKVPENFKHVGTCISVDPKSKMKGKFAPVLETVYNGQLWRCSKVVEDREIAGIPFMGKTIPGKSDIGCAAIMVVTEGGIQ